MMSVRLRRFLLLVVVWLYSNRPARAIGTSRLNSINLAMHSRRAALVRLIGILAAFPDNEWDWRIFDYQGVGIVPSGLSMVEFEHRVGASELGYVLSWSELTEFDRRSEQTNDCLIAAGCAEIPLEPDAILRCVSGSAVAVVRALDSTEWSIEVNSRMKGMRETLERLRLI